MSDALKEKLSREFKEQGVAKLSSADVAGFVKGETAKTAEPVTGTVDATVSDKKLDPMVQIADDGKPGEVIAGKVAAADSNPRVEPLVDTAEEASVLAVVTVTAADRDAFLDALVTGDRYVQPFSLFNGRITGKLRCRSQAESYAVMQQLNRECREGGVTNALEYSTRLRDMLLAAQVQELNGTEYTELAAPLLQTVDSGKQIKPAWLAQVAYWEAKNEGLIAALYVELKKFERKYWLMVDNADDQNFWNPGGSI